MKTAYTQVKKINIEKDYNIGLLSKYFTEKLSK